MGSNFELDVGLEWQYCDEEDCERRIIYSGEHPSDQFLATPCPCLPGPRYCCAEHRAMRCLECNTALEDFYAQLQQLKQSIQVFKHKMKRARRNNV